MSIDNDQNENELFVHDEENNQENQFLTFYIGEESYAIKLINIMEIIRLQKVTPIPEMDNFIKGIINLRGKIIPVMDIRLRFGLQEKEYDDRTCIIIVMIRDFEMGLVVDRVSDVLDIPEDKIEASPKVSQEDTQRFVKGIGKHNDQVQIILDIDMMLYDEEIETLKKAS